MTPQMTSAPGSSSRRGACAKTLRPGTAQLSSAPTSWNIGWFPVPLSVRIEQGQEVGRPSLVMLRAGVSEGRREVRVGGPVVPTVVGELA
jgi:predicted PhzF superfamily epimerase YddE/YHI9